ncbi:MAG: HlyD family type I secretion periplasmic adaptor subunit [Rubrivivax sp.]|nr:HlyD family type I secretion periplasmic adaptor subunit [Rubrivivax sp.]
MAGSKSSRDGLRPGDMAYLSAVRGAQVVEPAPAAMWAVYLMLLVVALAVVWASVAQVDIVAKANGRVIPEGREQVISSLEGGILRQLRVREGEQVLQGQELATLDPTRFESQQAEGTTKRVAMRATVIRLQAEATGQALRFGPEIPKAVAVGETESFQARQLSLNEAVVISRRSIALLQKELAVAESMSSKGLMSEVEVMRVRRQMNDLTLQTQERINRFRQEASADLVRVRTELSLLDEQMVARDDVLRRTVLKSPVTGIVKTIRANTIGGVVGPGASVMEIVPIGPRVLIEARIRPADIGFIKVGQPVVMKLSSFEYTVYGGLNGTVQSISPDAIGDTERSSQPEATYYRALVRADRATMKAGTKTLAVLPGMTGSVEIKTGQRSVLGFVVRPLMKTQEAFRER